MKFEHVSINIKSFIYKLIKYFLNLWITIIKAAHFKKTSGHDMQLTYTIATWWGSALPCYMILSRFLSNSSASFSSFRLDSDDAPHICISISAKRCSKSHCCCDNFVFNVLFSASTVWSLSRSRRISSSSASCDPNSGVAPDDSKWFNDPQVWPFNKYLFLESIIF